EHHDLLAGQVLLDARIGEVHGGLLGDPDLHELTPHHRRWRRKVFAIRYALKPSCSRAAPRSKDSRYAAILPSRFSKTLMPRKRTGRPAPRGIASPTVDANVHSAPAPPSVSTTVSMLQR